MLESEAPKDSIFSSIDPFDFYMFPTKNGQLHGFCQKQVASDLSLLSDLPSDLPRDKALVLAARQGQQHLVEALLLSRVQAAVLSQKMGKMQNGWCFICVFIVFSKLEPKNDEFVYLHVFSSKKTR